MNAESKTLEQMQKEFLGCVGLYALLILLFPVLTLLYGWILSLYWAWFVMPVFPVRPLTILAAAGISLFVSFFTQRVDTLAEEYQKPVKVQAKDALIRPVSLLIFGYLLHLWILHA